MSSASFVKLLRAGSLRGHHCGNGGASLWARTVYPQVLHSFASRLAWRGRAWAGLRGEISCRS
jgi:hypothetical protein